MIKVTLVKTDRTIFVRSVFALKNLWSGGLDLASANVACISMNDSASDVAELITCYPQAVVCNFFSLVESL